MLEKEDQEFDLLEELRKAAGTGRATVKEAIYQASREDVSISKTIVKASELEKFAELLEKVEVAENLIQIRKLLGEDTIPVELVIMDQFWGKFQKLIYVLTEDEEPYK